MAGFLDIFGFLAVLLRGIILAFEALLLGGCAYRFFGSLGSLGSEEFSSRLLKLAAWGMALTQLFWLSVNSAILQGTTGIAWHDVLGADFFYAGVLQTTGALAIAMAPSARGRLLRTALIAGSALVLIGGVLTSHSMARLENRAAMMAVTAAHHLGAAIWIGGLPFFLWAQAHATESARRLQLAASFTRQAIAGVLLLAVSGVVLAVVYIHSFHLIYGTSYGVMTAAKVILLGLLLGLGWRNNRIIWNKLVDGVWRLRLGRFTEAEIGIGFTTILAAASLTSQPPAIDTQANRVPASIIVARFTPQPPLMKTPKFEELSPATALNPEEAIAFHQSPLDTAVPGVASGKVDKPADIDWSEYNHNWAGMIVFAAGALAFVSRFRWGRWARHWPLAFMGLAAFLLLRADSENWPLGPRGFWESFAVAEVAQHRIFVLLIVLFAVFEWAVQTGRIRSTRAALVFPAVCALGGTLLLAHNHSLVNVQEQLLAELSHTPIAILGLLAGWTRWLEIRLPDRPPRWAKNAWPVCLIGIGYLLLTYREH